MIAAGPASYAARFTAGPARIRGIPILPLGWARRIDARAADDVGRCCNGAGAQGLHSPC